MGDLMRPSAAPGAEESESRGAPRTSRLEPIREPKILPWRKAQDDSRCHVYWMPAGASPLPHAQREWLLWFSAQLRERLTGQRGLVAHLFLQMKAIFPDLSDAFLRTAPQFVPIMGLSRRRGAALPKLPDEEYIEKLQKGKVTYDHKGLQPDYCYWFLKDEIEEQSNRFFGYGGLMTMFLKPEHQERPPLPVVPPGVARHPVFAPLLADNSMEKMATSLLRLQSPFFAKSKAIFGRGLEGELQYPGIKYIVPLFRAVDFFDASAAEIEEWFTLFDAVLTESPEDKGMLLASREDLNLDTLVSEILDEMNKSNKTYPEYA